MTLMMSRRHFYYVVVGLGIVDVFPFWKKLFENVVFSILSLGMQ
jgi:hypothetical protein